MDSIVTAVDVRRRYEAVITALIGAILATVLGAIFAALRRAESIGV